MSFNTPNPNAARDALIQDWLNKKAIAAKAINEELDARNKVVAIYFADYTDKAGTENFEIGNGFKLKFEFKQNYSVAGGKDNVDANKVLEKLRNLGPDGEFVAKRIFRWKAELAKAEYDKLSPAAKRIVNTIVTQKAGQPAVSLVEPKA